MKKLSLLLVVVLALVVFAGCKNDPDATYTVTYYSNGANSGFPPSDNNQYKTGEEATILGQGTLLRTGYEFLNWNTNADGTGESHLVASKITIKGAVFLYAIWVVKP